MRVKNESGRDSLVQFPREDTRELNEWARHVSQAYVAWYTGFFAFNAAGVGYVSQSPAPRGGFLCLTFVLFNVLGVLSSLVVALYGRSVHNRLKSPVGPASPLPILLWFATTSICGFSLVGMVAIWTRLAWLALHKPA